MTNPLLSTALLQCMTRDLSVADLIRTADTLRQTGQSESIENLYSTWIQYNHDNPLLYAVLFNYSVTLSDAGKLQPAREALEKAIAINAGFMPAYINLGRIYEREGNIGSALVQWSAAITKLAEVNGPALSHKTMALNQSARALESAAQDELAEGMLRQSLELDTQQREVAQHFVALRQRQCEWPVIQPWERVTREVLMHGISPLSSAAYTDDPLLHLAIAANYNKKDVGTPTNATDSWPDADKHTGPLRIGYVCSDFREHALGHLLAEVLELHDRKKVEIFAYYCGPLAKDPIHDRFKSTADHWTSISEMTDVDAAKKITEDAIQILVDLNGYTREGRTKLFALRPAPVIVNWLGYPGTMGSPYHNYLIADDWIIPKDSELYYSEKVLRVPCYQPSDRKRVISKNCPTRKDVGLPENAMVYCCFNGAHKITRFTFDRWLMILTMVPDSVLWLLSASEASDKRLKEYAAAHGVPAERIIFAEKKQHAEHLARIQLADLFLDTTPYGAHTTSSDALWMGIPVLTLSGRSFASRVCGSLVRSAGLPELVCTHPEDYVKLAAELGSDRKKLKPLCEKLASGRNTCTLFNMPLLDQSLEKLYEQIWADYKKGKLPQPDLSNLDVYLEIGSQIDHEDTEIQTIKDYQGWWKQKLAPRLKFRHERPDSRLIS
jgi:predicted O-linked N-acetylglucosamine transferase (SPINDLY family)